MSGSPFGSRPSDSPSPAFFDFNCAMCGRQLRVPGNLAGQQVKCPACEAVQAAPSPTATPGTEVDPIPPSAPVSPLGPVSPATPDVAPATKEGLVFLPDQDQQPSPQPAPRVEPRPSAWPGTASAPGPSATGAAPVPRQAPAPEPPSFSAGGVPAAEIGRETATKKLFDRITAEIGKIFVGQQELVLGSLVALFSNGHVLIESVPGLGKTLFVRTLGRVLGCEFGRIQFTADLMPSDITGAPIFDMKTQEFRFRPGPVFTQLLLADEINRSPAKTHAALLEIMQECRVTVDGKSHPIQRPFLVLATQNPIESEGTYNLPEAQLDRFMFKLVADYPQEQEEAEILEMHSLQLDLNERLMKELEPITGPEEILRITQENAAVRVDPKLLDYINKLVRLTRRWPQFHMGASPRAGIALMQAARTLAAFAGRDYAVPDDVVQLALATLRHRVILTAEAEVEGRTADELLTELIRSVDVPRL